MKKKTFFDRRVFTKTVMKGSEQSGYNQKIKTP